MNLFKTPKLLLAAVTALAIPGVSTAETVLRFATTLPESSGIVTDFLVPWADRVTETSDGELQIQVLHGSTVANSRNVFERVLSGVVDVAWATHGALPVDFPRTTVSTLPFEVKDAVSGSEALWTLYENGYLDGEYDLIAPLALVATPPAGLHSTKPINTLDDLAGLKIRSADRMASETLNALGATPIALTPPELYQGVSQGVVSSVHTPFSGLITFRLDEVTSDHLDIELGALPGLIFINRSVYEGLPTAAREALDEMSGMVASREFGTWFHEFNAAGRDKMAAADGRTVHQLSHEEAERWKAATAPVTEEWIAETPNGQAILDTFRAALPE